MTNVTDIKIQSKENKIKTATTMIFMTESDGLLIHINGKMVFSLNKCVTGHRRSKIAKIKEVIACSTLQYYSHECHTCHVEIN